MNWCAVLCVVAVVLTAQEVKAGFPSFFRCYPGSCFVLNAKMCECPPSGYVFQAKCVNPIDPAAPNFKCKCYPGWIRVNSWKCTCPKTKVMTKGDCKRVAVTEKDEENLLDDLGGTCIPGEYFEVSGRKCLCPPSGQKDEAACELHTGIGNAFRETIEDATCIPGEIFEHLGKMCVCPPSGLKDQAICELKTRGDDGLTTDTDDATCIPGEIFRIFGKMCVCPPSGRKDRALCELSTGGGDTLSTNMGQSCPPKRKVKINGKICICPPSGQIEEAYCPYNTRGSIELPTEDSNGQSCQPTRKVKINGKICICPPSGRIVEAYCPSNTRGSIELPTEDSNDFEPCTPGEPYFQNGVWCTCSPRGRKEPLFCTLPEEDSRRKAAITCTPGAVTTFNRLVCTCPESGILDVFKHCKFSVPAEQPSEESAEQSSAQNLDISPVPDQRRHGIIPIPGHIPLPVGHKCKPGEKISVNGRWCICPNTGNSKDLICPRTVSKRSMEIRICVKLDAEDFKCFEFASESPSDINIAEDFEWWE